jgi:hypothetical protein
MQVQRVKLIIKNMELLLEQLKLELEEPDTNQSTIQNERREYSNTISIRDLLLPEEYEEPEYREEPDLNLPNVHVRWRNNDV